MPNQLQFETSAYLLQHKDNPVDWYPWNDEALNKAKLENHLINIWRLASALDYGS